MILKRFIRLHSEQDYAKLGLLNDTHKEILEKAYNNYKTSDKDYHGWDTTNKSLPSNEYYDWIPDKEKIGQHFYYTINKKNN
jgi:hypothetical protein